MKRWIPQPTMTRKGPLNASGFTLLEVIIAFALLMLGFVASMALQIGTLNGWSAARDATDAADVARKTLDILRIEAEQWRDNQGAGPNPSLSGSVSAAPFNVIGTNFEPFAGFSNPLVELEAVGPWNWVMLTPRPVNGALSGQVDLSLIHI